ncbi:MAG: glycosyltransferase family 9 protein [Acidobacteria bacterium]|nr:glycosyltransferase family 9 protein [Acidobacteriota bacterium]
MTARTETAGGRAAAAGAPPHRILLVRLGALGDVVHAIPVAAALRRALPSARIDWLVSAKHREVLDLVPAIDQRLAINDRAGASGGRTLLQAIAGLRRERYDVAIDLQGLIKSAALARLSGATRVIGFASPFVREPLARWFYTEAHDPGTGGVHDRGEGRHIVEINLGILEALGIPRGPIVFPLAPIDSAAARSVRERTGGRYALLNPGAAWPNKRWPPERFAAVARALRARHALASTVLWGPAEETLAREVVAASEGAAALAPRTSIADLVALARGAALMVSGDTGPTHLAAAVGTPIVALFGPTRPQRNGPWAPDDLAISRAGVCQCHHLRRCRLASMCLLDVQVSEVLEAIDRRLARSAARG